MPFVASEISLPCLQKPSTSPFSGLHQHILHTDILCLMSIELDVLCHNIVACEPIARQRVEKHFSMKVDSWRSNRYGIYFRVNE
jgi:hypothetical protein